MGFDYDDENYQDVIPPSYGALINVRSAVPEPATMLLLGLGLMGLIGRDQEKDAVINQIQFLSSECTLSPIAVLSKLSYL